MGSVVFVLFLVGAAVFMGLVAYANYLTAKKRREAMAAIARQRGWKYTERDDSWADRFQGSPFGIGHDRRASNIVDGLKDERRFIAFDYRYSTVETSGKRIRTEVHPYSIVAISTRAVLPHLSVMPEGMISRMVGRLTGSDIEFESEQFNRAFTVTCPDRKFATDVLDPRMMEFLLRFPDLGWTLRDGTLMVASPGQHNLRQLDSLLAVIDGILDRVPAHVWKAVGVEPPPGEPQHPSTA